jgi:hypothetical protein
VFVILDADAYMDPRVVQICANNIDQAGAHGRRLWYMPYNKLYRLNEPITMELLRSDPTAPYAIPSPPPEEWLEPGRSHDYGHQYGAMMQIMPRDAFFLAGGFDPRFNRGWGSEDGSMLRAVDTLYCPHELVRADILHMYHVRHGHDWKTRRWAGQHIDGAANTRLAHRYALATGEPGWMRALVDEHVQPRPAKLPRRWMSPRWWGRTFAPRRK